MSSPLPPEMRNIPPPKEYRDPEPPMGMQTKTAPVSGPVNPNVGMPGIALAAQRERNKKTIVQPSTKSPTTAELALAVQREKNTLANNKAMMNPSATSPSGRVRTGVLFNETPRERGMQTPMNLPTPMMGRNPPEPVREPVMPPEPVIPPSPPRPPPRDIPMLVQRPPRQLDDEGKPIIKMYAKGGMVKASRGDGIAQRGRTRGKLC